jgi:hypothetical protein
VAPVLRSFLGWRRIAEAFYSLPGRFLGTTDPSFKELALRAKFLQLLKKPHIYMAEAAVLL